MGKMYNMIRIMDEKKVSMAELAEKLEMHKESLYRIRRSGVSTTATLEAIAKALEVEMKELL